MTLPRRHARPFDWLEQWLGDLRYGGRGLLRVPGFTAVSIVTLALGIGATTAVFSVVNGVLLRPLAYADPDRLVTILHDGTNPVSAANYLDWRERGRSFAAMAAAEYWTANLTGSDRPEHIVGVRVTQDLLPSLGIQPLLGRVFVEGEDRNGADHEVILGYRLWQRRFNQDRRIIGRLVNLNGEAYTVVGVMPPEFRFPPFWATRAEMWAPLSLGERAANRGSNSLRVFARLRPGVSLVQAREDLGAITTRLEHDFPGTNRGVVVSPLKENVVGKVAPALLILLGAVGCVLLIACSNVAHMLLARTTDREKEIAVRTALGASRSRVITQFLIENLLLAALGASAGLLLAHGGVKALVALAPAYLPRVDLVHIDSRVVLFLVGITVLAALVSGLAPALHASVGNLSGALKEGGRGGGDGVRRSRLRGVLVASEFGLAFVLLVGAGLMIRSFAALQTVDPGFKPQHVLSMVVSVAGTEEAEPGRRAPFYRQLIERVRSLPGVTAAGGINHLPLAGDVWGWSFRIEGRPKASPGASPAAVYRLVMPGYFETMRLPLLRGRDITAADDDRGPGVVIVSERAAARYWPGADPIGGRITFDDGTDGPPTWLTVIGVAANASQEDWASKPQPEVYLAALQNREYLTDSKPQRAYITLVARTAGPPADMAPSVRQAVWSFDRNLSISDVLTLEQVVAEANAQPRFEMLLLVVFGAVALVLAAAGIYGVVSYAVARRTREIGIRMSLGANAADVWWTVMRQVMMQAMAGAMAGAVGALLLSRFMSGMLYGVRPTDQVTYGGVALVLGLAGVLAAGVPARKATKVQPVTALRSE